MSASNSSTTHKPTPVADDTTNTPYNPDKHGSSAAPSPLAWKKAKTGNASSMLLAPLTTLTLSDPPAPRVDGMPAPYPPAPPAAPRYCTRQTTKQMQATSGAATKDALAKLQQQQGGKPSALSAHAQQMGVPRSAADTTADLHHIMYQYADKQQALCTQLCDLNTRLQARQDEIVRLKDAKYEAEGHTEHYKGIADSYEDDIDTLTEERDAARTEVDQYRFALRDARQETRDARATIPRWCVLTCLVVLLVGLHVNHEYDLDIQEKYAEMMRFLKPQFWLLVTTCIVEEGDAAERHNAHDVPVA